MIALEEESYDAKQVQLDLLTQLKNVDLRYRDAEKNLMNRTA
jgi:hypothetical protein